MTIIEDIRGKDIEESEKLNHIGYIEDVKRVLDIEVYPNHKQCMKLLSLDEIRVLSDYYKKKYEEKQVNDLYDLIKNDLEDNGLKYVLNRYEVPLGFEQPTQFARRLN